MKYFRPETLDACFDCLAGKEPAEYTFLAGGTDLLTCYDRGMRLPENLIDIKRIPALSGINERPDQVEIGALTTIDDLKNSAVIRKYFRALSMACEDFAGVQIRHRGTIGGNICNASPAGDTLPPLYTFNAYVKIISARNERLLPISKFIQGPGLVNLKPGEILQSIVIPKQAYQSTFYKLGLRQAMAIAVVNFAIAYKLRDGVLSYLSIAAGAVAPTVVYLTSFSDTIKYNPKSLDENIDLVDEDIKPITDIRSSAEYRRMALKNVLKYRIEGILNINNTN